MCAGKVHSNSLRKECVRILWRWLLSLYLFNAFWTNVNFTSKSIMRVLFPFCHSRRARNSTIFMCSNQTILRIYPSPSSLMSIKSRECFFSPSPNRYVYRVFCHLAWVWTNEWNCFVCAHDEVFLSLLTLPNEMWILIEFPISFAELKTITTEKCVLNENERSNRLCVCGYVRMQIMQWRISRSWSGWWFH